MSNTQPSPDTIATVALELTKAIGNTESGILEDEKVPDPKAFYLNLYKDCHQHVKDTTQADRL